MHRINGTEITAAGGIDWSSTGGITASGTALTTNDEFTIEMKPPSGAVLNIQRTLPSQLDLVMDLN